MKNHKKLIAILLTFIASAFLLTCVVSLPTRADDSNPSKFDESYFKKHTGIANLYKCYAGHMESPIVIDSDNSGNGEGTYAGVKSLAKNDNTVVAAVPNYFFGDVTTLTCQEFLGGKGNSYGGLTSLNSKIGTMPDGIISTSQQKSDFLKKLGYVGSDDGTGKQCARVEYSVAHYIGDLAENVNFDNYKTPYICAEVDSGGKLTSTRLAIEGDAINIPQVDGGTLINPIVFSEDSGDNSGVAAQAAGQGPVELNACAVGDTFATTCMDKIKNRLPDIISVQDTNWPITQGTVQYNVVGTSDITESTPLALQFTLDANSAKTAATNIFEGTRNTFPTVAERVSLYQIYLNHDAEMMYCSIPDDKVSTLVSSGYINKAVNLVKNGEVYSNCYVKAQDKTYIGFDGENWYKEINLSGILDFLASNKVPDGWASYVIDANATIYGEEDTSDYATQPSGEADEVNCYNSGGALGWILCPIIDFTQKTITGIYEAIVTNFLEFRASNLDINGSNQETARSVYSAWQTFQTFANIIFVAVFLIVIFSQVTGVGIDNLGIKRVLPKLIIAAILINLSYIICMLAVDISNILGVSLNRLFASISVGTTSGVTASSVVSSAVSTAVTGAVLALGVGTSPLWGPLVIIPLFLGLITVLLGVLFFFILLGARQAGIIILIVVSPVAFACYMLPNTKNIFDRWFKMLEGLLILYPICGAVMGGSAFASKILLTVDTGFLGQLIAMLVGVVPFFFIPTLLRGAFSAMGNLGARISGFGQGVSRRLTGAIARSEGAKEFQTRLNAGLDRNGNQTWLGRRRENIANGRSIFSRVPGMQRAATLSRARGLVAYEKMQDELDFASRPELIQSEAEARRFSRRQAAEDAALVNSGVANRTGDVKNFASADDFEEGTLAYAAMQAARSGNVEAQYAATERMLASGHHGAEAYRQVLQALEQEGNTAAIQNFAKAGKNSRHAGDLKSGARSTFDYINSVANGDVIEGNSIRAGQSIDDYVAKTKFSNMSEAQLFNTDNEELERYKKYINGKRTAIDEAVAAAEQANGGPLSDEQRNAIAAEQFSNGEDGLRQYNALVSQAEKAYSNERLRGNAKESRQNLVADIAGVPVNKRASQTLDVPRDNSGNAGDGNSNDNADGSTGGSNTGGNAGGGSNTGSGNATPRPAPQTQTLSDSDLARLHRLYGNKRQNNVATLNEENLYDVLDHEVVRRKNDGQPHPDLPA